jgi:hypothetical protein
MFSGKWHAGHVPERRLEVRPARLYMSMNGRLLASKYILCG